MNFKKICKTLALSALLSGLYSGAAFADSSFVDLKFKIGEDTYTSMNVEKQLSVAPFIQNERTLVPIRAVLEEMGFQVDWNSAERKITCTQGSTTVKLQIDNNTAYTNGRPTKLDASPTIVNGATVVPLRFIAENFGANVSWDIKTQSILVTKSGTFDTGSVLMYKSASEPESFYLYNGSNFIQNPIPKGNTYKNAYMINNSLIVTTTSEKTGNDNLLYFKDNAFIVAKENFEVTEVIKYGNSLIINGRNQINNYYELLKFDGGNVATIATDFMVGKYIEYNGKLIINKYDSYRDYYLIAYDGLNFSQINKGYAVNDFKILADNKLYVTGTKSAGEEKYLSRYDFTTFTDLYTARSQESYSLPFELSDLITTKTNQVYVFKSGTLYELAGSMLNEITFSIAGRLVKVNITDIYPLNGSLLLNVSNVSDVLTRDINGDFVTDSDFTDTARSNVQGLMLFDSTYSWNMIYRKVDIDKIEVLDGKVIAIGKDYNNNSENNILLVYDSRNPLYTVAGSPNAGNPTMVYDVTSLDKVVDLNGELIMSIQDRNRINGEEKGKILKYNGILSGTNRVGKISDLLVNFSIEEAAKSDSKLLIKAKDETSNKTNLYTYNGTLQSLKNNVQIDFWQVVDGKIFMKIENPATDSAEFYVFNNGSLNTISKNVEPEKIIKLKGNFYLIYGNDDVTNNDYLYLYDSSINKLYPMKGDYNFENAVVSK